MNANGQTSTGAQRIIALVDDFFDGVFAPLDGWVPELVQQLSPFAADASLSGAQLATMIKPAAYRIFDTTDRPLYGAGFCASDALVRSGNPLAWWQGDERALLASSTFGPGQAAIELSRLEWYRVPHETGKRHVAGPFVDYLCSNEITITSTLPVIVDGVFWGVACADVLLTALERVLQQEVDRAGGIALLASSGRVVLASDPGIAAGDRLPGFADALARSERYPFAVVG